MLFNSLQFLLFFPIVTVIYFLLPPKFRWVHLLMASCLFYAAFIPVYILILFFTILVDYIAGILIEDAGQHKKKMLLYASVIANLGVLLVFKYFNFFTDNVNAFLQAMHLKVAPIFPLLNIILPIGLSFHTFQAMSYTIEVYRGNQKAERHLGIYALYVMFYPQMVAGPIERPQNMLHQFKRVHQFNGQNLLDGLRLMLWGFFKKLVIADRVALYVNVVFNHPGNFHYLNLLIATLFFTIQIYCDFSGYSDIAIGAAKTMGFDLMTNFNRPYFAKNIQAFWKRWHISLSTWFRDYLYIALGGNRVGAARLYLNVGIVFFISGFWHGANWTYVIWGALHALFIIGYMLYQRYIPFKLPASKLTDFISLFFTFSLISFAWIFFRANTVADALLVVKHIATRYHQSSFQLAVSNGFKLPSFQISLAMIFLMFVVESKLDMNLIQLNKKPNWDVLFCSAIGSLIVLLGVFHNNNFIYFQF